MTTMRRLAAATPPVILAALFVMTVASTTGTAFGAEMTALRPLVGPGEPAPPFTLEDLDGKTAAFRAGNGKPSLIVFWTVFCPLCRELTPAVNEIARRHRATIRFASINLDGKRFTNAVHSFVKENGITYPVLLDSLRGDFFIASDPYGVEKTPTAVLVDASGKVHSAYAAERMKEMVRKFDEIVTPLIKAKTVKK
jgi:thiol-disulfide isomerase/thioredoxin